ncbi:dimethylamine monooxygenase subunit DmmA family protein [Hydrogenophaga taeniospiralis]|uniref:dimethylamine monooxygenase subunit DmmA family protein n=1 Tax=Hydrogenophaga taeniospiralis TaxID=65656 RepID=UPI001CFA0EEB|nr:dimethylamine monooxygenase subunit DmmA family protein [Hydrogenophaga taeniospiralis]UCU95303.1 hypothetical protein KI616_05440 [Hydrogenophaga taeniospiralis]
MQLKPSEIKSRPVYAPLAPQIDAGRHWLVLEGAAMDEALLSGLAAAFAPVADRLQVWSVGVLTEALSLGQVTALADLAALQTTLADQGLLRVSDRLFVQGSEPFVWSVFLAARQLGLAESQIQLAHAGSQRRRVWCTHCHGSTEGVTTNVVACAGCGRHLLVRDHFSRRHGAFMGVMVDAEQPGVRPAVQEVFP